MSFASALASLRTNTLSRAGAVALFAMASTVASQSATAEDVVFTVHKVTALDAIDITPADFYVRVVIDGKIHLTPTINQKNSIEPNWVITQPVKGRYVKVFLELWDKDLTQDDQVDINGRTDTNKRPLQFTIDMRRCRLQEIAGSPKCGEKVTVSGNEKKKATLTFSVTTNKAAKNTAAKKK